jgi:sugar lactone lactonase YvrE
MDRPAGLTYDSGMLFVADTNNNRIQKFDTGGSFVGSWGSFGDGQGQFDNPVSVAVDSHSGYVFITHGGSKRIQVFDKDGKYIDSWGDTGTGIGQFKSPVSVAFGLDDKLYVADKEKSEIEIFKISHDNQGAQQKIVTVKTTEKNTHSGGGDSNEKKQDNGQSDGNGKIEVSFGDARGYKGKANLKIWNLDNDETLVKEQLDFAKISKGNPDCLCKTVTFNWKGNHVGDAIAIQVTGGGGGWEDASRYWHLKKDTTRVSITLDEIGE